jgi:hypothetical protein
MEPGVQRNAPAAVPRKKSLKYAPIGGNVGCQAGLNVLQKNNISLLCRDSNPGLYSP